jgi:hypothetical protein
VSNRALTIIIVIVLILLALMCGPVGTAHALRSSTTWIATFFRSLSG